MKCHNAENEPTRTVHVLVRSVKDASTQTEPDRKPSPASLSPGRSNGSATASPYTVPPPRKEPETSTQPHACCNCQVKQLAYQPLPGYMMATPVQMPTCGYYLLGSTAVITPGHVVLPPGSQPAPGGHH